MKLKNFVEIKYGKSQKNVEDLYGIYPILGTGGIIGRSNCFLYDMPSVLLGRKGAISKPFYIAQPFWTVDTLFYTNINAENVFSKYLYYQLSRIDLSRFDEGSAVPSLSTKALYEIDLFIDNIQNQQHIVDIIFLRFI